MARWAEDGDRPAEGFDSVGEAEDAGATGVDFVNHFAADVDSMRARVMYAVQQALALSAFDEVMGLPAWKSLPSWYLVAQNDEAIPPDAERQFAQRMGATTIEIPSSHVAMVSHPAEVAELIENAAASVGAVAVR